jgi:hypothetical protein
MLSSDTPKEGCFPMKIQFATACAVLSLGMAGAAFADGRVTATLEQPTSGQAKFIAAHATWTCTGGACVSGVAPDTAGELDGCKDFAKKMGRVSAYGEFKPLDAKALAKCNMAAAAPATVTTANAAR